MSDPVLRIFVTREKGEWTASGFFGDDPSVQQRIEGWMLGATGAAYECLEAIRGKVQGELLKRAVESSQEQFDAMQTQKAKLLQFPTPPEGEKGN